MDRLLWLGRIGPRWDNLPGLLQLFPEILDGFPDTLRACGRAGGRGGGRACGRACAWGRRCHRNEVSTWWNPRREKKEAPRGRWVGGVGDTHIAVGVAYHKIGVRQKTK